MDGAGTSSSQFDSDTTQPPDVPLDSIVAASPSTPTHLVPGTRNWFGDRRVVNVISEAIQTYYKEPFTCLTDAPPDHKAFWWNCFKTKFTWDPAVDQLVKKKCKEKTRVRLKDLVNKALNEDPDKIITWMTEDLRARLRHKREHDEVFKKRSARNRKNKVEGSKGKIGHGRGSISSTMWLQKLTETLNRRPSAAELFVATHSKVDESGHRVWCDSYAQGVYDKYEQLKVGCDVHVDSEADDHLFFKACGGYNNKGRIYGLGSEGPSIFERPSRARGSTAEASSYTSPVVTQLQAQLHSTQSELQTTQAELQTMKERLCSTEDELKTTREELEATRRQLRADLLELHARFDSFSSLLGHPTTRGGNSLDSS